MSNLVNNFRSTWALCCSLCCFCALLAAGCASAPPDHFYTLIGNSPEPATSQAAPHLELAVTVESVTLPEAVDRVELVIRTGSNGVKILENQLWAESLKSAIPRAVAANLSDLLGAPVSVRSDRAGRKPKYLVSIDITRFDSMLGEAAVIEAQWNVRPAADATAATSQKSGKSMLRVPVRGGGFEELVAAHAQALAGLSGDIAVQIKTMEGAAN